MQKSFTIFCTYFSPEILLLGVHSKEIIMKVHEGCVIQSFFTPTPCLRAQSWKEEGFLLVTGSSGEHRCCQPVGKPGSLVGFRAGPMLEAQVRASARRSACCVSSPSHTAHLPLLGTSVSVQQTLRYSVLLIFYSLAFSAVPGTQC